MLTGYIYKKLEFDSHNWPRVNIITDVDQMNKIIEFIKTLGPQKTITPNGHLRKEPLVRQGWFINNYNKSTVKMEFGAIYRGNLYRFLFWPGKNEEEEKGITGADALKDFRAGPGKALSRYALTHNDDIEEIKKTIPKPLICLTAKGRMFLRTEITNAFHIDIHSAYPAFASKKYPEMYEWAHNLYLNRKTDARCKNILNFAIGAMQSLKIPGRRYPQIAKDAIEGTRDYILELTRKLEDQGFTVLAYNTDGIFVRGVNADGTTRFYHDENEGSDMGQWGVDHVFEKLRFKSAGSYEYIENGQYHATVRGHTRLDSIKPRDEWEWGDIFHSECITIEYYFNGEQLKEVAVPDEEENKVPNQKRKAGYDISKIDPYSLI